LFFITIFRFAFIGYLVAMQIFILYVRIQAKAANDRTPITLKNPLSSVLQAQLGGGSDDGGGGGGAGMMKNLASSFLSSESTIMEYDLKQAKSMQSGMLTNMAFMWFLHFKMGQVQPLIIQTVTGISNMVYSPLFQVYVMGRNLERPYKNPATKKLDEAAAEDEEEDDETSEGEEIATITNEARSPSGSVDDAEVEESEDDDEDQVEESSDTDEEEDEDEAVVVEDSNANTEEEKETAGETESAVASGSDNSQPDEQTAPSGGDNATEDEQEAGAEAVE